MVELDDRTGNILTTIALFAIVAAIAYATRTTIAVFVLALLFAYLLEPAVTWVHLRLTPRASSRNSAIAVVYVVGLSIVPRSTGWSRRRSPSNCSGSTRRCPA